MRFEFYHSGLDNVLKLSVDGTVSHSVHFSHWQGNETPAEVKADTSTEIALNLVGSPNRDILTRGIDLVTNNHFDTDGVLSVWTVLSGARALELAEQLIPAAEAGDFSEFTNDAAVRASIVLQGSDQASPNNNDGSPLAQQLAGEDAVDDARAYQLVLPEIERVLTHTDDYEHLWRGAWERIETAIESFERGRSTVQEFEDSRLSLIMLAPEAFSASGFNPTRHAAPYTAISHYAHGEIYLITTPVGGGWVYRLDYPYYSWAETIVRKMIEHRELTSLLTELNNLENEGNGQWKSDSSEMTSAAKFLNYDGVLGASALEPGTVSQILNAGWSSKEAIAARS
jgi:hypothetical protein